MDDLRVRPEAPLNQNRAARPALMNPLSQGVVVMAETAARTHSVSNAPRTEHAEGTVARTIEQQTARLPSDLFLWAAGGSILGSLCLQMAGRQHASLFVGQWAPTFLILGLYNKLV